MIGLQLAISRQAISLIMLGLYSIIMVIIAIYSRKKATTLDDFFLGGKGLGGWMTAFAYGTTYFSAVVFVGYAGKFGWNFGLAAMWIGVGNALIGSWLAWKVFATRTRNMTRGLQVKTMPEFFAARYKDDKIKLASGLVIFIFLIPYAAAGYQGLSYIFSAVFQIDYIWCVLIMAGLTALYLFVGGYLASAISNFVQGLIMFVGVVAMLIIVMDKGDWGTAITALTQMDRGIVASTDGGFWNSNLFNLIIILLLTSVGICGLPQSVHKFYSVKDNNAIKKGTVISTVFALVIAGGAYFIGGYARYFLSEMPAGGVDDIMPVMLESIMPPFMMGVIAVLIFAASMSTLSSLSLVGASSIAMDLYKGYVKPTADEKQVKLVLRIMCVAFVVVSVVLALVKVDAIVTLMGLSWGTLAGCFIGPYFYGLYSKKATKAGAWASIITSLVATFALMFIFGAIQPSPAYTGFTAIVKGGLAKSPLIGVICMALSFIVTPLVSHFTKAPEQAYVENMFRFVGKDAEVAFDGTLEGEQTATDEADSTLDKE